MTLSSLTTQHFPSLPAAGQLTAALKSKWSIHNDLRVDVDKAAKLFGLTKEQVVEIVKWYESELINTKFILNNL